MTTGTSLHDALMHRDNQSFAGMHVIVDLYNAQDLNDIDKIESAMRDCVKLCEATLLHIHLHHFTPNDGVTGVAVLSESHISVHTWPEYQYAAFDIFMCGESQPERAITFLRDRFKAEKVTCRRIRRGTDILRQVERTYKVQRQ